jgi:hypothetical protein
MTDPGPNMSEYALTEHSCRSLASSLGEANATHCLSCLGIQQLLYLGSIR